ncbi:MAG: 2-oxo acid dehydrogenase subunit E2 [Chloroflexota bacterium]|nr:MAG: 2-oxo acid dehydrogenase subunit E2 [Chloroflexota bacterium]
MATQVIMPQLGESVIEGTITKWLKAVGDHVEEYEPLLEVNTDKVDSEIPSPSSGKLLEIVVPEGTTVNAGTVLAVIGMEGEAGAGAEKPAQTERTEPEKVAAPVAEASKQASPDGFGSQENGGHQGEKRELGFISPVVAKIASEHSVDLSRVKGTGQGGRITKRDILQFLERREEEPTVETQAKPAVTAPETAPARPESAPTPTIARPRPAEIPLPQAGEVLPLSPVRRAIAEHMVFSKHTSPHVTTVMEGDLSRVVSHRSANKAAFDRDGVNLTFTAYFISAIASALKAYPIVNSSWSDEGIVLHREINIGMATSLGEGGLIVPVIKNADSLSLLGLARAVNDLAGRARAKQLKPEEVKGGTFTLTNHGTSGSLFATPIINQPQCGILGVGAIQKRVVVVSDQAGSDPGSPDMIAIRPMVYISLTFDHRILDGAIADYFLGKVVESLQSWK